MKKLIVLLLAMMMLVSADCGAKKDAPEEKPGESVESLFTEGTFEGTGKGHNGEIKVAVIFSKDQLYPNNKYSKFIEDNTGAYKNKDYSTINDYIIKNNIMIFSKTITEERKTNP